MTNIKPEEKIPDDFESYYSENYYVMKCSYCKKLIGVFDGWIDEVEYIMCTKCAVERRGSKKGEDNNEKW